MEKILFGWIATSFNLIYKLPQIYKLYKKKDASGISVIAYILQSTSYLFYILHGSFNEDYPIVVMGSSSLIQCFIIIWLLYKYRNIINNEDE